VQESRTTSKDGSGIGRGNNCSKKKGFQPTKAEQEMSRDPGEACGQQHTQCRQAERGRSGKAKASQWRFKTAVKQNDRKRQGADEIGGCPTVEFDAEQPILTGKQAYSKKHKEQGGTETLRDKTRQRRERNQSCTNQNGYVERLDQSAPPEMAAANGEIFLE